MKRLLLVLALTATLATPAMAHHSHKKKERQVVEWHAVPPAVQTALQSNSEGGRIVIVEKKTKSNGSVIYDGEVKMSDGNTVIVEVNDAGTFLKKKPKKGR